MRFPAKLLAAMMTLFVASPASAVTEWVHFVDRTDELLNITTITGLDREEKDIAQADLDKDGWIDLVVVRKFPVNAGREQDLLLMNEAGVLQDRTALYFPEWILDHSDARDVLLTDLNGDGWDDLLIVTTYFQQPRYYRNKGEIGGTWQGFENVSLELPTFFQPRLCAAAAGDINGDGALDIFYGNYTFGGTVQDTLHINDGNGAFTDETTARLGDYANVFFGTSAVMADMNNDGAIDIIKNSVLGDAEPFNARAAFLLFNDGQGVFNTTPYYEYGIPESYMHIAADLNNDGMLDVVQVTDFQDGVNLATAINPDGTVDYDTALLDSPRTDGRGGNLKAADLDGDGDLDVAISPVDVNTASTCDSGELGLFQNDGLGALTDPYLDLTDPNDPLPVTRNFHLRAHDIEFIDINGDGKLDLFQGLCDGYSVMIQVDQGDADGDGNVTARDALATLRIATGIDTADASKTARLDVTADGMLTAVDALGVLRLSVGLSATAP